MFHVKHAMPSFLASLKKQVLSKCCISYAQRFISIFGKLSIAVINSF